MYSYSIAVDHMRKNYEMQHDVLGATWTKWWVPGHGREVFANNRAIFGWSEIHYRRTLFRKRCLS